MPRDESMSTSNADSDVLPEGQALSRLTQFSVDHAADAIFWVSNDFRLVYVNHQAARSLGYSRDELMSMRLEEIDPSFTDEVCRKTWQELRREGRLEFESQHRQRDGREFPVWVTSNFYQDGEIELSIASCRDLTKSKAAELALLRANEGLEQRVMQRTAELAASEARYQDLYHNAPDMFATVDARTGCIVQCNDTLARVFGCRIDQLIGRPLVDLFDDESRADAAESWAEFLVTGETHARWLSMSCGDRQLSVSVRMTAVRSVEGEILLARSSIRDVTQTRRAVQEAERHRSEMAHVARLATTGEMAAGLAHELNQPLYALNNFAQGAIRRLESDRLDRDSLLSVLRDIAQESQRAAGIIRSLRRYVGRRESLREAANLNESVRQVVSLLRMEARHRLTSIELQLSNEVPLVWCDEVQIEQVLMNLILNAIEASCELDPSERRVYVTSSLVDTRLVQYSVIDRGVGLTDQTSESIFDAFYTTKEEGLGLGLTISRRIIEAHGGRLVIKPNKGRGVTASFTLPSEETELTAQSLPPIEEDRKLERAKLGEAKDRATDINGEVCATDMRLTE